MNMLETILASVCSEMHQKAIYSIPASSPLSLFSAFSPKNAFGGVEATFLEIGVFCPWWNIAEKVIVRKAHIKFSRLEQLYLSRASVSFFSELRCCQKPFGLGEGTLAFHAHHDQIVLTNSSVGKLQTNMQWIWTQLNKAAEVWFFRTLKK